MEKGDLLHIGTAYVEVHTFKGKDYITVRDFSTTTNALSKEILELEEENKKLKEENETLREELISRIRQPKNTPYGKGVADEEAEYLRERWKIRTLNGKMPYNKSDLF